MPLYVYKCAKCGHEYEKIELLSALARQKCPKCKGRSERQLTSSAFQFKGSGWYATDYARQSAPVEKKEGKETGETKEGKEVKEGKEMKEGKETKEVKETRETKEEKPKKEKKAGKEK